MDDGLESALDRVGRLRVFDLMRSHGWTSSDAPPSWVWWEAIRLVEAQNK